MTVQACRQPEIIPRSRPYSHFGRCDVAVKFAQSFWQNSSDCLARLGANMTVYTSEMELYIIFATLVENSERWNRTTLLILKCHCLK